MKTIAFAILTANAFAKSRMSLQVERIELIAPSVAVTHGTVQLLESPPAVSGLCHWIRVLVKKNGTWLISDFQNTLVRTGDAPK